MEGYASKSPSSAKDRVISNFPQALFPDTSPYKQFSFSSAVNSQCALGSTPKSAKVVVVGDIAVGKTSLINRFCHDTYSRDYKATIGVDFEVEKFTVMSMPYSLHIWDTAGAERFKCIAASYYRGANIVIVVFDMSNIASLRGAILWKEEACLKAETDHKEQFVFLVGSKKDLLSDAACASVEEEAMKIASDMNAELWSVSSKSGLNVKQLFFRIVALSFDKTLSQESVLQRDSAQRKIGNDLIHVRKSIREEDDAWQKMRSKLKCCN